MTSLKRRFKFVIFNFNILQKLVVRYSLKHHMNEIEFKNLNIYLFIVIFHCWRSFNERKKE